MGIDGKTIFIALLALLAASPPAEAGPPSLRQNSDRNIEYDDGAGHTQLLTQGGEFNEPVLSPNGRMAAFIHFEVTVKEEAVDKEQTSEEEALIEDDDEGVPTPTSLWVVDLPDGTPRLLLASRPSVKPEDDLRAFGTPRFSLDGGFLYIRAYAWATSSAVHQINVATGAERYVTAGYLHGVIRTGRWRGNLLVEKNHYSDSGVDFPIFVVRPDGKVLFKLPDSEDYGGGDQADDWMKGKGWDYW